MKKALKQTLYGFHVMFHPFDGFWDLKHEKRGSVFAANIILVCLIITQTIQQLYTGYLYQSNNPLYFNFFGVVFNVLVPFILWCTSNWALTTLMDGEGNFRDIYIASAYALVPMIVVGVPLTIISNFLTIEMSAFYSLISAISIVWAGGLMVAGVLVTHQYTLSKTILTSIFIVVGIGVIIFLLLLFFNLIQRVAIFIFKIIEEALLRQ